MQQKRFSENKIFRIILLLCADIIIINLASFLAIILRFGLILNRVPLEVIESFRLLAPLYTVVAILIFAAFKLYRSLWEYASVMELIYINLASICSVGAFYVIGLITHHTIPRGVYVIACLLMSALLTGLRFSYRLLRMVRTDISFHRNDKIRRIMIVGAGIAGNMLIQELKLTHTKSNLQIVCAIDDDKNKIGSYIRGVKVVGDRYAIEQSVNKYKVNEIIFAIPASTPMVRANILDICKKTTCKLEVIPSLTEILQDNIKISQVRNVVIEDLLGRDPVNIQAEAIMGYVKDKTILVTGGGGSIGSELCRQIAAHNPKQLIIFDIYENNAYAIQNELKRTYGDNLDLVVLIGSVRDSRRVDQIFDRYRPNLVFHAAAHKHVPLMETSPNEAIKNNVFGTLKVSNASSKYGVERFILISTDKAVNPTNIMGATKRMCEMVIQSANNRSETEFVAVRFGNVLGSNGSVIPLFKSQIETGGPVTVTHPDIIRYFMTIPEAVSLVLQAGANAHGGEIFVLDMGEPVRILDLAENMIRLSGRLPYKDIPIQFTGLRPGEKLYEELLMDEEGLKNTDSKLIHIGKPIQFDEESFHEALAHLYKEMMNDRADIRKLVQEIVPTYCPKKEGTALAAANEAVMTKA